MCFPLSGKSEHAATLSTSPRRRNLAAAFGGDEDDHCLRPALFMKRVIPASGLLVLPKTGHTLNLEEPYAFNNAVADFLTMVEAGKWLTRDPRANPDEIIRSG